MRDDVKCCATCKHCMYDFSVSDGPVGCILENPGDWVHQEEEDIFTPQWDYCTKWELDFEVEEGFWKSVCEVLSKN